MDDDYDGWVPRPGDRVMYSGGTPLNGATGTVLELAGRSFEGLPMVRWLADDPNKRSPAPDGKWQSSTRFLLLKHPGSADSYAVEW